MKYRLLSIWWKEIVLWIDAYYLELILYGLVFLSIVLFVYFIFRKRQRAHARLLSCISSKYEKRIQELNRRHFEEIRKAEAGIKKFKKELHKQREEYQDNMQYAEKRFSLCMEKLEKEHAKIYSKAHGNVFELKQEMDRMRIMRFQEVKNLQKEIKKLKEKILLLHENHAREIERSENKISDLRKQLQVLIYKA